MNLVGQLIDDAKELLNYHSHILIEIDFEKIYDKMNESAEPIFKIMGNFNTKPDANKYLQDMIKRDYITNEYPNLDLTNVEIVSSNITKDNITICGLRDEQPDNSYYDIYVSNILITCDKGGIPKILIDCDEAYEVVHHYHYNNKNEHILVNIEKSKYKIEHTIINRTIEINSKYGNYFETYEKYYFIVKLLKSPIALASQLNMKKNKYQWIDVPDIFTRLSYWNLIRVHIIDSEQAHELLADVKQIGSGNNKSELMEIIRNEINDMTFMKKIKKIAGNHFDTALKIEADDGWFGCEKFYRLTTNTGDIKRFNIEKRDIHGNFRINFMKNRIQIKNEYSIYDNTHGYVDYYEYQLLI